MGYGKALGGLVGAKAALYVIDERVRNKKKYKKKYKRGGKWRAKI